MAAHLTRLAALLLSVAIASCTRPGPSETPAPSPAPVEAGIPNSAAPESVWDGVYAGDQARRGSSAYSQACSSCHAEDLRGSGNAPSLVGLSFMFVWENRSVGELFTAIRTQMPTNAPNSLPEETYLAILAHMLERNGFPAGETQLAPEPSLLDGIAITAGAPGGAR